MKQIEVTTEKTKVTATYKPLLRQVVAVEFISPYKGLMLELAKDDDECNLFVDEQVKVFVRESLILMENPNRNAKFLGCSSLNKGISLSSEGDA